MNRQAKNLRFWLTYRHFAVLTSCLFINFYLFELTLGAPAVLTADVLAEASTAVVVVEASSFTSAFAEAPFIEQQAFLADALLIQQADEDLPLHFPSASHAVAGVQKHENNAAMANNATNFFIRTSKKMKKNTTMKTTLYLQYIAINTIGQRISMQFCAQSPMSQSCEFCVYQLRHVDVRSG